MDSFNRISSQVILGILFYGVLTPIAFVLRLLGKDLLKLKRDPGAMSYWIKVDPEHPAAELMKHQF